MSGETSESGGGNIYDTITAPSMWGRDELIKLMENVKAEKALYDYRHTYYGNSVYLKSFWSGMDLILKKRPGECLAKWTNLRLTFKREYEAYLETKIRPGWAYFEKMYFLHAYLKTRNQQADVTNQMDDFCRRIQAKRASSVPPIALASSERQGKAESVKSYNDDPADFYKTVRRTPHEGLHKERKYEIERVPEREHGGEWERGIERGRGLERGHREERERAGERERSKERERGKQRDRREEWSRHDGGADHRPREVRERAEFHDMTRERGRHHDRSACKNYCEESDFRNERYHNAEPARLKKLEREPPLERETRTSKEHKRDRTDEREFRKKASEADRTFEEELPIHDEITLQRELRSAKETERELRKIRDAELERNIQAELRAHNERLERELTLERELRKVREGGRTYSTIETARSQSKDCDAGEYGRHKTPRNDKIPEARRLALEKAKEDAQRHADRCRLITKVSEGEFVEKDHRCMGGFERLSQRSTRISVTSISEPSSTQQDCEVTSLTSPLHTPRKKLASPDKSIGTTGPTVRFNLDQSSEVSTQSSTQSSAVDDAKNTSDGVKHCCHLSHSSCCPCNRSSEGDRLFLLSLLPDLQRLDGPLKGKVKLELQNVLQKHLYPK